MSGLQANKFDFDFLENYKNLLADRLHEIARALGFWNHEGSGYTLATQREVLKRIRELQHTVKVLSDKGEEAEARICKSAD